MGRGNWSVADPDNQIRGGGRSSRPCDKRDAGSQKKKNHFSALWALVWSKHKGAGPSDSSPISATAGSGLGVR